ncbi:hypothetical protein LTR10_016281 [Elasticomyces elasticus]|uniref:DUF4048 domain-containing protein n=1 Tax=Exophiala sideris TaxID=1016849 RepID=A0ABR0JNY9_9EURO|nr:hypothetical protein LTR10_016281 [Elasticomyces elasticus]KAK5037885.1 hypothetical protein LTS07_001352 [Exophiala sideris]KAK5043868.1 hypothetical protein LTR13_000222 [Exophiala sideris]KAK5067367.1 hypothetical protein LTR69_001354 [Exophiala sideris]KAK5182700.1 hypothetical protein LTR44_005091 [Eurotiomycetes sp. CCFEE 6388]
MSTEPTSAPGSSDDVERKVAIPQSPTRTITTDNASPRRQNRGLALNFPILLPTNTQILQSPTAASSMLSSPVESAGASPRTRTAPFRSPDPTHESRDLAKSRGSADFLTLLAGQERKVLELREELQKAEVDLLALKKQWALFEANKKRDEVKHVKKLQPLALDDVAGRETAPAEEDVDEERRRKRALVERSNVTDTATVNGSTTSLSRKGSKRVFEGRHTRTLSLLSPTSQKPGRPPATTSIDEITSFQDSALESGNDADITRPPLTRMSTLNDLMENDNLQLKFGKTYRDLAANRRSMPAGADVLVKQGKSVYDGVREGLWTFFEDIRQATVGEEGVNGTVAQQRPSRPQPKRSATGRTSSENRRAQSKEPSFWNEFGIETPRRPPVLQEGANKTSGHAQQRSTTSTDSANPPSLLPDTTDDDVEVGWDAWDSPVSNRQTTIDAGEGGKKSSGNGLPWPEIETLTPTRLTSTVSDLMKEWDASHHEVDQNEPTPRGDNERTILCSPHK